MSDHVTHFFESLIEEDKAMSDLLQATSPQSFSEDPIDCTKLDRIVLRPSPDVQDANMEGETVLLDLRTGRYYTLNRLGSVIWEHCTGQRTISDIHERLCDRFEVASEQALDDLVALINQMVQEGLILQERR